jgi:hypothetical protein
MLPLSYQRKVWHDNTKPSFDSYYLSPLIRQGFGLKVGDCTPQIIRKKSTILLTDLTKFNFNEFSFSKIPYKV